MNNPFKLRCFLIVLSYESSGSGLQKCLLICQHCPDTFGLCHPWKRSRLQPSSPLAGLRWTDCSAGGFVETETREAALSCQHCPAGAFGLFTSSYVGSGQRHIFTSRRSAAHCAGEFVETETRDAALMLHSSRFDAALSSSSHLLAVSEHVYVSWQNIFVWHQHLC